MVSVKKISRIEEKVVVLILAICLSVFGNVIDANGMMHTNSSLINNYDNRVKKDALNDMGLKKEDLIAGKKEVDISKKLSALVPESANSYAKSRFFSLVNTVQNNQDDFGIAIQNILDLRLGKPFVIYAAESLGTQDPIYYYPILNKKEIVLVLTVIGREEDYSASIGTEYVSILKELNYQKSDDYIFYQDGENLCAENYETSEKIAELSTSSDATYENEKVNVDVFEDLSIENKVKAIVNSYSKGDAKEVGTNNDMREGAKGFSSKKGFVVRLDTSGCLVSQYNDNNCWAASVATTLRYLYYPKYRVLTARDVCKKMGKGYNEKALIEDKQKALKKYGCTYSELRKKQISFSLVSKNILAQKPVLVSAYSGNYGHAVTIIGYTTYGGINQITFHNPGTNTCTSVEYKTKGTTFSYGNRKWKWERTLSYK